MLIYTESNTPRFDYIASTLLPGARITCSIDEFLQFEGPRICYASKRFDDNHFHIRPHGLLNERGITGQRLQCNDWNDLKVFFSTGGDIPFDIFAAAFFLLSRYEEYLPHCKDSYGRYAHTESLAYREQFLHLPLVDLWLAALHRELQRKYPLYHAPQDGFRYIPTYDIDIAYAMKGKGWLRKLYSVLTGKGRLGGSDPFDVYEWLVSLHNQYSLSPVFFFLMASRRSVYDKNLDPRSKPLQELVRNLSQHNETGIHPSWQSHDDVSLVHSELEALERITGKKVKAARQHYIRVTLPVTYRNYISAGITTDYSMGYGSINGFRASTSRPFYWYDLLREEATVLLLHPFCYMEANSYFEQSLNAAGAAKELQQYFEVVRSVNGQLITIFHNHFLTAEEQWEPWRNMYASFLERNFGNGSEVTSPSPQAQ